MKLLIALNDSFTATTWQESDVKKAGCEAGDGRPMK